MTTAIHPSVSAETAEKLRRVVAAIPAERFDMATWVRDVGGYSSFSATDCERLLGRTDCGTTGCLFGWAIAILGNGRCGLPESAEEAGAVLLGLNVGQSESLSGLNDWPWVFKLEYRRAGIIKDNPGMLAALRDRVEHFIATGK